MEKKEYQSRCVPSEIPQLWYHPQKPLWNKTVTNLPRGGWVISTDFSHPPNPCHYRARPAKKDRMVPINPTIWFTWNPNDPCFDWRRPCFGGLLRQNRGQRGSRWLVVQCQNAKNLRLPLPAYEESMVWYLLCVLVGFVLGAGSVGGKSSWVFLLFYWVNFAARKLSKTMIKW